MAAGKKKFSVTNAQGTTTEVEATEARLDESGTTVTFYDGDNVVSSFRGFQEFQPLS